MNQEEVTLDIREILLILRKHLVLIVVIPVVFAVSAALISMYLITPFYQSSTTIIINPDKSTKSTQVTYNQVNMMRQLVSTYAIILKSDTVLDQVIQNLDIDTTYAKLSPNVTVNGIDQSEVIQITVKDPNPQLAADIANEISKVAPDVIIQTVKAGSVEVIAPAKPGDSPVSPNKKLYTGVAFLVGIVIAAGIAFLIEMLDKSIRSEEDIKKVLEFPIIGVIPRTDLKA